MQTKSTLLSMLEDLAPSLSKDHSTNTCISSKEVTTLAMKEIPTHTQV
jgi:hypothetical protein